MKPVFNIDIETCQETCRACDEAVRILACIEDPLVIPKIPDHLHNKAKAQKGSALPEPRGVTGQ